MMATPENRQIFNPLRNILSTATSCFDGLEIERYCDENIPIIDISQTSATKKTNSARVVKRAQNPIVLFAKLRKPQFHKLRKLRKFRIAIYVFCENSEFSVCDFLFQWISWISDKMAIGKTCPTFVLGPGVSFLVHFYPNMKVKFEKFCRLTNFFKKISNIVTFAIATYLKIKLSCVAIAIDAHKTELCYLRNCVFSQSQSILQPWIQRILHQWSRIQKK